MTTKKTSAAILLVATTILALSACNTTAGIGKDVKSTGKAIERTADDARPN